MHSPQRILETRAIRLRPKRDVKTCMRLSPSMNSKTSPMRRKERVTRASELLRRVARSFSRPVPESHTLSLSRCARGGAFSSLSRQASVLSNAALDSPIRADNFAQSARLRALATANFSTWGDALRIMQQSSTYLRPIAHHAGNIIISHSGLNVCKWRIMLDCIATSIQFTWLTTCYLSRA